MKVRCLKNHPSGDENVALGYERTNSGRYELAVGEEYVVLGISFLSESLLNRGVTFLLKDDFDRCAFVPIFLLEISDSTPSKYWRVKKGTNGNLQVWPEEFFANYFFDDLSEGEPRTVKVFRGVFAELEEEARTMGGS